MFNFKLTCRQKKNLCCTLSTKSEPEELNELSHQMQNKRFARVNYIQRINANALGNANDMIFFSFKTNY